MATASATIFLQPNVPGIHDQLSLCLCGVTLTCALVVLLGPAECINSPFHPVSAINLRNHSYTKDHLIGMTGPKSGEERVGRIKGRSWIASRLS